MAIHRLKTSEIIDQDFLTHVEEGLSKKVKSLSSKYFYDEEGDKLFQQIMELPEYYLTRCEMDILKNKSSELSSSFYIPEGKMLEVVELGAGDGSKTKYFLKHLIETGIPVKYKPIDISPDVLDTLKANMLHFIPEMEINGLAGDYFYMLDKLKSGTNPKLIMFMGSNLGNMNDMMAENFLLKISSQMNSNDRLLLGLDLKKAKNIVLPAYHDKKGITAQFNMNLLRRMNEELGMNFDLKAFKHAPEYDEKIGIAYSYIESLKDQKVHSSITEKEFYFSKGEKIHTEISRKYDDEIVQKLISNTGLHLQKKVLDTKGMYANYILIKP